MLISNISWFSFHYFSFADTQNIVSHSFFMLVFFLTSTFCVPGEGAADIIWPLEGLQPGEGQCHWLV